MPFPTHEEIDGLSRLLFFQSMEQRLRERAPELADRIERPDAPPFYLKVSVACDTNVVLGAVRIDRRAAWVIADPRHTLPARVWELTTPEETLVEALKVRATAWLASAPEPSPWRWNQASKSVLTQLADLLAAEGFAVTSVVAENRAFVVNAATPDGIAIRTAPRSEGAFVRGHLGGIEIHVALKPSLGWLADVQMEGEPHWRRLDLVRLLGGQAAAIPGTGERPVDIEAMAKTLALAAAELPSSANGKESPLTSSDPLGSPRPMQPGSTEAALQVTAQLRTTGFSDVWTDDLGRLLRSQALHIVWRVNANDELGKRDLQQLNGIAAADGKVLLVITSGHVTRDARAFSDHAKAFVFQFDLRTGLLRGGSQTSSQGQCLRVGTKSANQ